MPTKGSYSGNQCTPAKGLALLLPPQGKINAQYSLINHCHRFAHTLDSQRPRKNEVTLVLPKGLSVEPANAGTFHVSAALALES